MKPQILLGGPKEDEIALLSGSMSGAGFAVIRATTGSKVISTAREQRPALIVLDATLVDMPGLQVCKCLKTETQTKAIPIILLTAGTQDIDRVLGLELGADDCMTKPANPRELVLRIQSLLRRNNAESAANELIEVGSISLNRTWLTVKVDNQPVKLTATEFKLLALFMERCGRVQTRHHLLREVWEYDASMKSRTVDMHVKRLRRKLGDAASNLETVRNFGYRLSDLRPT